MLASALVLLLVAQPGVGKRIDVSLRGASLTQVLDLLQDVSKKNLVLLEDPKAPRRDAFDLEVKGRPWDTVLFDVLKANGLSRQEQDNVIFIGSKEQLAARKPYGGKGKRVSVELVNARPSDAIAALSAASGERLTEVHGGRAVTRRLRNLPADFLASLIVELSGASAGEPADTPKLALAEGDPPCVAPNVKLADLELTVVATGTATPTAITRGPDGQTYQVAWRGCLGDEAAKVKAVRPGEVVTSVGWRLRLGAAAVREEPADPAPENLNAP